MFHRDRNYAIIVAATLGFLFVQKIRTQARPQSMSLKQLLPRQRTPSVLPGWLWAETAVAITPLVDAQELIEQGQHVTRYGPLFSLYLIHVFVLLGTTLYLAFWPASATPRETRSQLSLIGGGIVAMAAIALVTNVFLPYAWMDFRFIHVGTLSTIFFLVAVGYAVFAHHLFSVHRIVRAAFVYAGLIALALELYQLAVTFLAHLLPVGDAASRGYAATALALVVNAFTQQSVRRWLNRLVDHTTRQGNTIKSQKSSLKKEVGRQRWGSRSKKEQV